MLARSEYLPAADLVVEASAGVVSRMKVTASLLISSHVTVVRMWDTQHGQRWVLSRWHLPEAKLQPSASLGSCLLYTSDAADE